MTDPYDVYWHMEHNEGNDWIVARVPQAANTATQARTFDELQTAVRELVSAWLETLQPEDITLGLFYEETEEDFNASLAQSWA